MVLVIALLGAVRSCAVSRQAEAHQVAPAKKLESAPRLISDDVKRDVGRELAQHDASGNARAALAVVRGGTTEWLAADGDAQLDACAALASSRPGGIAAEWQRYRYHKLWIMLELTYRGGDRQLAGKSMLELAPTFLDLVDGELRQWLAERGH